MAIFEVTVPAGRLEERMIIRIPSTLRAPFRGEDFIVESVRFSAPSQMTVELRDKKRAIIHKHYATSSPVLCWHVGEHPYICPHSKSEACNCLTKYT